MGQLLLSSLLLLLCGMDFVCGKKAALTRKEDEIERELRVLKKEVEDLKAQRT